MTIRVVTDSSSLLPQDVIARYGIEIVPLTINWEDGDTFLDGEISYAQLAERVDAGGRPTTAAPSPARYADSLERVLADAEGAVIITPPAQLSATHSHAVLAAEQVGTERVGVLDSRSAAGGQGLVVHAAARAGESTSAIDGVREHAGYVATRVRVCATLERLDYLRRSGRVPGVAALATGVLDLHPLFRIVDGTPSLGGVARGEHRAIEKLFGQWVDSVPHEAVRCHAVVFHASREEVAKRIRERLTEHVRDVEVIVAEATAAIGTHIGPGMLGLAWWWDTGDVTPPR